MDRMQLFLAAGTAWWPWIVAAALALDAGGVLAALWAARTGRLTPLRARVLVAAGVLVAGLGPLVAVGTWLGTGADGAGASGAALVPRGTGVLALLLVGAGVERLAAAPRRDRRAARALEALALSAVFVGLVLALSIPRIVSGGQAAGFPAPVAPESLGWALALGGATGVVAANASGRGSGPVPYGRRVALGLAALLFATGTAAGPWLGAWLAQAGAVPDAALPLGQLATCLGIVVLAGSAGRALQRPSATAYWRPAGVTRQDAPRARRGAFAQPVTRIMPTPPRAPRVADLPVLGAATMLAAPAVAAEPFTPPALRRAVLLDSSVGQRSAVVRPPASEISAAGVPESVVLPGWHMVDAAEPTNRLDRTRAEANLVERPPLSPQFVAAVVRLQTDLSRSGRAYEFDELVALFGTVRPRAGERVPLRGDSALAELLVPMPLVYPEPTPSAEPPADDEPATRTRLNPRNLS